MASEFIRSFEKDDGYYLALMLLYFLKDDPRYSTVSEMVYLLDRENFLNIIKYYGGQEIYIPDSDEVAVALKTILLYQYRVINKLTWTEALKKSGFNQSESAMARGLYIALEHALEKTRVGENFLNFIGGGK